MKAALNLGGHVEKWFVFMCSLLDNEKRNQFTWKEDVAGLTWRHAASPCDSVTTVADHVQTSINSQHVLLPAYLILYSTATTRNQKRSDISY